MDDDQSNKASSDDDRVKINQAGKDRDQTAEDRDERAEAHDQASEARDVRAEARDERAEAREKAAFGINAGAAADRAGALRDRLGGGSDRTQAADDREAASADRQASAKDREASSLDGLTHAYRRETGVVELEREIGRAKRTKQPFTLVFVDVDNLKGTNDEHGHAAGDKLLRAAADAIRSRLRSYDLIIRFGGDEFVCGLSDLNVTEAAKRFVQVNEDLATQQASVTFGMTELKENDTLEDLIARADEAMYKERG
jgi:diguanylate cyclase (GGDEF)-like protein